LADTKISAGADPGTLTATDKLPLARSASTTAYAATMAEIASYANTAYTPNYSAAPPIMDGTAAPGVAAAVSRGDHIHPSDLTRAPLASPTFTGTPAAPTATTGTNSTQIATTAYVLNAVTGGTAAAIPGASYADNGGFTINQRAYTSGAALTAGSYGHDRWKAGAGGATYTFAAPSGPSTSITITAGTLQQIIEGGALAGGTYTLSWTGTAQGRIGVGSYAASPVSGSVTAGANTTIEFNAGTLSQVKFEPGSVATPWVALPPQQQLAACQRFYQTLGQYVAGYASGAGLTIAASVSIPVAMRATPTVVMTGSAPLNLNSVTSVAGSGFLYTQGIAAAAGQWAINVGYNLSADL
jgi:hypothetical protein